jgi:Flp pilus assembly protein protease CpaA
MLVTGIIGGIFSLVGLVTRMVGMNLGSHLMSDMPLRYMRFYRGPWLAGISLVGVLMAAFIIYASLKMKELEQWEICVAASILAMIPCISPCCIIGLPVGIWSLVVLLKPEIKSTFH